MFVTSVLRYGCLIACFRSRTFKHKNLNAILSNRLWHKLVARFQTSAAEQIRSSLFSGVTQWRLVINLGNYYVTQWPSGLGRVSAVARLLGLRVRIPPGGVDIPVLCVVRQWSQRRADPSSRGVLPTVLCRSVLSRNLENTAALARVGL